MSSKKRTRLRLDPRGIDSILDPLHKPLVPKIAHRRDADGENSLRGALASALPSRELREVFVSASITHFQSGGTIKSFWDKLRGDARFGSGDIEHILFTVQLAALTGNHAPLIEILQKKRQDGELRSLSDLARLDAADWKSLIQQTSGSDLPAGLPGKGATERARNFANAIAASVEEQFPTAVIASRLSRDDEFEMAHKPEVAAFLDVHTDFEFGTTNIGKYLADHAETAFKAVEDRQSFTDQLEKMQRVAHVAPRYDQMRVLLTSKLDSAQSIASLSREQFEIRYKDALGGTDEAAKVHEAAVRDSNPEQRALSISDPCSFVRSTRN